VSGFVFFLECGSLLPLWGGRGKPPHSKITVICRLEDAHYEGHSLVMLRRIAAALQQRVEMRFVPFPKPQPA
jgi:hypothetical protein